VTPEFLTPVWLTPGALADAALAFGLWTAWGLLHSVTAARRFKAACARLLGPRVFVLYPLAYSLVSLGTFYLAFRLEPDLPQRLWAAHGFLALLLYGLQLAGLGLLVWAGLSMHALKMFGLPQFMAVLRGRAPEVPNLRRDFTSTGAYALARHPMHTGGMLLLIFQPRQNLGGFVFALFGCLYMVAGSLLEERRLASELGPVWADYARRVPMFLPRLWPRTSSGT